MNDLLSVGLTFFGISITLLVLFIPDYYIKLTKLKKKIGDLESSVNNSMISIAKDYDGTDFVTIIKIIQEEEVKLLMPPVENKLLARAAFFFMTTSFLSAIFGLSSKFFPTYLGGYASPVLYVFGISMIISFFFAWVLAKLEIQYYEVIAKRKRDGDAELVVHLK